MKIYSEDISGEVRGMVEELAAKYGSHLAPSPMTFGDLMQNHFLMVALIRRGLPFSFFEDIRRETPLEEEDWIEILGISSKTLQRYEKQQKIFKPLQSQKILEMVEVTVKGLEVFENMDLFTQWMHTPSFVLGGMKPVDLIKDSYGKEMVLTELAHIDHGIFV